MSEPFPSPTVPADSRTEVFLRYLDFFRSRVTAKIQAMPDAELRSSRLPSGWTPLELAKHLRYVELRWLEWGFEGRDVGDPWGDRKGDRWSVGPQETAATLLADLRAQGARSRAVIVSHLHGAIVPMREVMESARAQGLGVIEDAAQAPGAIVQGKKLQLNLGYSHPILVEAPEGISFVVESPTKFHVDGTDKQKVGEVAAKIRKLRKPDPYKAKGVKYAGEVIRRKVGKSGK